MIDLEALDGERAAAEIRQRLHALAYLATGDMDQALEVLAALAAEAHVDEILAASPPDGLLAGLVRVLRARLGRFPERTLDVLEDAIRSDVTRAVDPAAPPIDGVEERIPVLLGELRRRCLGWVLLTLPPQRRLAWLLVEVLRVSTPVAAAMLGTTEAGLHTLLFRARKALAEYLEPRCGHLVRPGYCTCESRLGVALAAGFVQLRPGPPPPPGPFASLGDLYRDLTPPPC